MAPQTHSETTFWTVLGLRRLGRHAEAGQLTEELRRFRDQYASEPPRVDYFATSLPDLLLFTEDPVTTRDRRVVLFDAQLGLLDGRFDRAEERLGGRELANSRPGSDLRLVCATLGEAWLSAPVLDASGIPAGLVAEPGVGS